MNACPTESQEQQTLFEWAELQQQAHPQLKLMFHVPNEGRRSVVTGRRLKSEGMKKGVPDICLPVARRGYHGLFIEMKRLKGGRVSDEQNQWLALLKSEGYAACVCQGWAEAADYILWYLKG